jgi:hypothetical protein
MTNLYRQFVDVSIGLNGTVATIADSDASDALSKFNEGDLLFIESGLPLAIDSISGSNITIQGASPFAAASERAVVVASNIKLREALAIVEENNAAWALHFDPFLNWVTTDDNTATMYDVDGNQITVTAFKSIAATLATVQGDVQQAQTDLGNIQGTLTGLVSDAESARDQSQSSERKAAEWAEANEDVEVDTGQYSAKHHAIKAKADADQVALDRVAVAGIFDSFDDKYLGSKTTDPATDNDGYALIEGQFYWNSTSKKLRWYTGIEFVEPSTVASQAATDSQTYRDEAQGFRDEAEQFRDDAQAIAGGQFVPTTTTINGVQLSDNISLTPADIGALPSGGTAIAASELATARTISLSGNASGSTSFDGSGNVTINVTVNGFVPTGRTINGQSLTANRTIVDDGAGNQFKTHDKSECYHSGLTSTITVTRSNHGTDPVFQLWQVNGGRLTVDGSSFSEGDTITIHNTNPAGTLYIRCNDATIYAPDGSTVSANVDMTLTKAGTVKLVNYNGLHFMASIY